MPCYVGGPFFSFFSQPQMNVFNRVDVPKKMFLYTDMGTRPWRANHDELLRWYDYWLKGIETGIMDEPTIRYHTTGMTTWQAARDLAARDHRSGPTSTSTAWSSSVPSPTTGTRSPTPSCSSRCTSPRSGTA